MKQTSDSLVVPGAAISHTNGVHTRASKDGVLL